MKVSPKYRAWIETQTEYGRIGGIKSGEVRRKQKAKRELDEVARRIEREVVMRAVPEGALISEILEQKGIEVDPVTLGKAFLSLRDRVKGFLEKDDSEEPTYDF